MNYKRVDTKNGRFYEIDGQLYPSVTTILQVIAKPYLVPWAAKLERELCLTVADQVFSEYGKDLKDYDQDFSDSVRDRLGRMRAHQKEMEKARDIGSDMHQLIENELRRVLAHGLGIGNGPAGLWCSEEAVVGFHAWQWWAKSVNLVPLEIERVVYSKKHGYAGTMDTLAKLTDERTGERVTALIDWKSSKGLYREYQLQNAAYSAAWAEMKGRVDMPRGLIVRLPKSPDDKLLNTDRPFELCWVENAKHQFDSFLAAKQLWEWTKEK